MFVCVCACVCVCVCVCAYVCVCVCVCVCGARTASSAQVLQNTSLHPFPVSSHRSATSLLVRALNIYLNVDDRVRDIYVIGYIYII